MPKSGKATVNRRVQDVYRLLLAGAEFAEIRQYATEHDWQISDRQVRRYMETAYEGLATTTDRSRKQLLGRHLMQRRALYARALRAGDLKTALQVLRDEAALEALYPPTRQEITGQGGEPIEVMNTDPATPSERAKLLLDLIQRTQARAAGRDLKDIAAKPPLVLSVPSSASDDQTSSVI